MCVCAARPGAHYEAGELQSGAGSAPQRQRTDFVTVGPGDGGLAGGDAARGVPGVLVCAGRAVVPSGTVEPGEAGEPLPSIAAVPAGSDTAGGGAEVLGEGVWTVAPATLAALRTGVDPLALVVPLSMDDLTTVVDTSRCLGRVVVVGRRRGHERWPTARERVTCLEHLTGAVDAPEGATPARHVATTTMNASRAAAKSERVSVMWISFGHTPPTRLTPRRGSCRSGEDSRVNGSGQVHEERTHPVCRGIQPTSPRHDGQTRSLHDGKP